MRIILLLLLFISVRAAAQSTDPPYKRFPDVPPFRVLLTDSSTLYGKTDLPKNKPTVIIIFSPECEHCRQLTDSLLTNLPAFEPATFVMVSLLQLDKIRAVHREKSIANYPAIVMGKDKDYLLPGFYDNHHLPFIAIYNRKGKLVSSYEGTIKMRQLERDLKK